MNLKHSIALTDSTHRMKSTNAPLSPTTTVSTYSSTSLSSSSTSSSNVSYTHNINTNYGNKRMLKKLKQRDDKCEIKIVNVIVELLNTEQIFINDLKTVSNFLG